MCISIGSEFWGIAPQTETSIGCLSILHNEITGVIGYSLTNKGTFAIQIFFLSEFHNFDNLVEMFIPLFEFEKDESI